MTTRRRHVYQPDPDLAAGWGGVRLCRCGLPPDNDRHDVADQTEAAAWDARRIGERDETEER